MARVTVEDCIDKVANRFKLVLMAAKRARDLERGAKPSVVRDNDKSTILALREIAEEAISIDGLENLTRQNIINDEAELPYERDEVQLRSDNESNEEDEDIDDEDFEGETEDDDDWETSDNPYNRRLAVNNDDGLDDPAFSEEESEYDPSDDKSADEYDDEDDEVDGEYENEDDEYFDDEFEDCELEGDGDQEDEK